MKKPFKTLISIAVVSLMTAFFSSKAISAENYQQFAPAMYGYDVVNYHTKNKAAKGKASHAVPFGGLTYMFKSQDNADLFRKDPKKYLPAYNGYAALGVANGKKIASHPKSFKIVKKRLFFNSNKREQKKWQKDLSNNIAKADKSWGKIKSIHPNKL